jgi:hypothetical protein
MRRQNLFLWLVALVLILACAPSVATPFPTADPDAVNTFIVQTADAASTLTAAAVPSASATSTKTPTPRGTATVSPSPTATFIFILPGLGAPGTATLPGISNGTSNSDYGCNVFSMEPLNGTIYPPRNDFVVTWGVKNIGKETWYRATMNYVYVSGDKLHKVASYDIPKGAETGKNVFLTVEMETFKNGGTYTTKWALVKDNQYFCPMTITIVVN